MKHFTAFLPSMLCLFVWTEACLLSASAAEKGKVELKIVDQEGALMPCRIHLKNEKGEAVRAANLPFWYDHFVCPGQVVLELSDGPYQYEIERGPEFKPQKGTFDVTVSETKQHTVRMTRIVDLATRGWYSGELHVHRALKDVPLLMQAEDLHVAPVITWWNGKNLWSDRAIPKQTLTTFDTDRYYDVMGGEDERQGGALLYFGLKTPLDLPGGRRGFPEYPSPMKFVKQARQHEGVWIDIEKPFWWDVPVWLASGQVDSIGLANNHMCRSLMFKSEAWGKPRDSSRLPPPRGNGYWSQEIYYHILNCGLRIPPSAGSASGVLKNPVGYNRVYVNTDDRFSYETWWEGLKAGRSFVTNGPLLLCRANGHLPGHVFSFCNEQSARIELEMSLESNDVVPALEVIKDGSVVERIRTTDKSAECSTTITFTQSGWFLVRAIADKPETFRFASTAPFYVEIGEDDRRISRRSAEFFIQWLAERKDHLKKGLKNPEKLREVLVYHDQAESFWQSLAAKANADCAVPKTKASPRK